MSVQFNGRRPLRKPGDKRANSDVALAEAETSDESFNPDITAETSSSENARLTPAQLRQQRQENQAQVGLVSYRGFSLRDGNVKETELLIPPSDLLPNPFEARMRGPIELQRAEETITALAREMQQNGFEGSLRARRDPHETDKYQLVYGHLRVEAAKRANIKFIKVAVEELSDREMLWRMFNENTLRDDPGPVGDGETMLALIEAEGLSYQDLADRIGKSKQWVADRLELGRMSARAKDVVRHNPKSYSLVLKLGKLPDETTRNKYLLLLEKGVKPAIVSQVLQHDLAASATPAAFSVGDDDYDPNLAPFQPDPIRATAGLTKNGSKVAASTVRKPASLPEQEAAILRLLKGFGDKIEQASETNFSPGFLEEVQTEIRRLAKLVERARKHQK